MKSAPRIYIGLHFGNKNATPMFVCCQGLGGWACNQDLGTGKGVVVIDFFKILELVRTHENM